MTIAEFQQHILNRFGDRDKERGVWPTFGWFMEEVGELATALQNNAAGKSPTPAERANLEEEFADVIAWLTTIANINGIDLEHALKKYTEDRIQGEKH